MSSSSVISRFNKNTSTLLSLFGVCKKS